MEKYLKNKWQVRALALALLGFVAGALSLNFYRARAVPFGTMRGGVAQALERLNLNTEQRPQVEKILNDSRTQLSEMRKQMAPQVKEIRQQTDERLKTVLTPEQWQQWQQTTGEMRTRREFRP